MVQNNFCDSGPQKGLYTIAELIKMAFKDRCENRVNFKIIHIILMVLAKRLNILHRMVNVKTSSDLLLKRDDVSKIFIDEVKVCAKKSSTDQRVGQQKSREDQEKKEDTVWRKRQCVRNCLDFEKERIFVVYVPPEEAEELPKETDARRRKGYPLTLTTQDSYLNLFEKITNIQKRFGVTDSDIKNRLPKGKSIIDSRTILKISARLEKTEESITDIMGTLVVTRKGPIEKVEENLDSSILKESSPVWGFRGAETMVKVYKVETSDPGSSWTAKATGELIGEFLKSEKIQLENIESEEILVKDIDYEEIQAKDIKYEEKQHKDIKYEEKQHKDIKSEEIKLKELELDKSGKKLDVSYDFENKIDNITKNVLQIKIKQLKCDFKEEFTKSMQKICENLKATRNTTHSLEKKMPNIEATKRTIDNIGQMVSCATETQDRFKKYITEGLTDIEEFLNQMEVALGNRLEKMSDDIFHFRRDETAINNVRELMPFISKSIRMLGSDQKEFLYKSHKFHRSFKRLVHEALELSKIKIKRVEFEKVLEDKIGLFELNSKVRTVEFNTHNNEMHNKLLAIKVKKVLQKEMTWQEMIDRLWEKLDDLIDIHQLESTKADIHSKIRIIRERLDNMIDLLKPFERVEERVSKTLNIEKCLICGSRPERAFLKRFEGGDNQTITECFNKGVCIPLTPVLQGQRSTCEAYGKKPCEKGDMKATLTSLINSSVKKKQVNDSEKQLKQLPCKPCNKPKKALRSKVIQSDDPSPDCDVNPSCIDFTATQ